MQRVLWGGVGVALVVLVFLAARGAYGMYDRMTEALSLKDAAEGELARIEAREEELTASIESLSSLRGLEAQVRQRFGLVRPGEGEIVLVAEEPTSSAPAQKSGFFGWFQSLF